MILIGSHENSIPSGKPRASGDDPDLDDSWAYSEQ